MTFEPETGLAEPSPPPPRGLEYKSREREEDRPTRKPLAWWDRAKILLLLLAGFMLLVWSTLAQFEGLLSFKDAFLQTFHQQVWLVVLIAIELVRQAHFLVSEHVASYHRFWSQKVFGGFNRRVGKMKDWNRFRVARVLKVLFLLVILDLILAKIYQRSAAIAIFQLPIAVFRALPYALQLAFAFFFIAFQFIGLFWLLSRGGVDVYFPDDIKTRFSDVWGQDSVLAKVKENMLFLDDPESIEEKGGYVPGGILLWGPPGTGKTLMAEAAAGETAKPFVFVDPGAFINMFFGIGILKVKSLFRKLRKLAVRYGGVIVFFDEADSLGNRGAAIGQGPWGGMMTPSTGPWTAAMACNGLSYLSADTALMVLRGGLNGGGEPEPRRRIRDRIFMGAGAGGGGGMGTLQALLTELSGLKKPRGFFNRIVRRALGMRPKPPPKYRILVMMATNMPQALDEALLRPGRIDRIYKVGYPSKVGRIRTYEGYLAKVSHSLTAEEIDRLATITPYATGASIKDMVNEALITAIRDGRQGITWKDVMKAKQLKDLGPPEDVEYVERERHAVAVHEACHAVAAYKARRHLLIDMATIEKGGTYLGLVASIPPEDQFTRWRSEYEADIMVSLASLVGERMFFEGDSSSGVSGDLESATMLATLMEGYWGMGSTIASHGVTHEVGIGGGGKPGKGTQKDTDFLSGTLGERIEKKLAELRDRTIGLLKDNRSEIMAVAHALEINKTVTGEDVEAIIEGREGPLLDGRPYHTSEFAQMAEAYHVKVVAAHKAHSKVEAKLPSLPALGQLTLDASPAAVVANDGESAPADVTGNGELTAEIPSGSTDGEDAPPAGDGVKKRATRGRTKRPPAED